MRAKAITATPGNAGIPASSDAAAICSCCGERMDGGGTASWAKARSSSKVAAPAAKATALLPRSKTRRES
jgi:hypothetical protein